MRWEQREANGKLPTLTGQVEVAPVPSTAPHRRDRIPSRPTRDPRIEAGSRSAPKATPAVADELYAAELSAQAKRPDLAEKTRDLEALRTSVADAARVRGGIWFSYLFVLFYLLIAAGGVTHKDLLYEAPVRFSGPGRFCLSLSTLTCCCISSFWPEKSGFSTKS